MYEYSLYDFSFLNTNLSPDSCVGPMVGLPQRRGRCTPPPPNPLPPHHPHSPQAEAGVGWALQTPARRRAEAAAARLKLQETRDDSL